MNAINEILMLDTNTEYIFRTVVVCKWLISSSTRNIMFPVIKILMYADYFVDLIYDCT